MQIKIDRGKFLLLELGATRTGKLSHACFAPGGYGRDMAGLLRYCIQRLRIMAPTWIYR